MLCIPSLWKKQEIKMKQYQQNLKDQTKREKLRWKYLVKQFIIERVLHTSLYILWFFTSKGQNHNNYARKSHNAHHNSPVYFIRKTCLSSLARIWLKDASPPRGCGNNLLRRTGSSTGLDLILFDSVCLVNFSFLFTKRVRKISEQMLLYSFI